MKRNILSLMFIVSACAVSAQTRLSPDYSQHQQSINLTTGTQGIGVEYRYGAFDQLSFRGGVSLMPVSAKNVFTIDGFNSDSKIDGKFSNLHLLADYTPFKGASFFRLVGGAAYFMKAKGKVLIQPTDNYKYGDIAINQEQVGQLNLDMDWQGVAPYFGFGLLKAFPNRLFNVNLDLGTYYLKQPSAQITGTGMLAGNETQSAQFQRNVSSYRWYPQVQLNFNFRIK